MAQTGYINPGRIKVETIVNRFIHFSLNDKINL